MSTSSLKDCNKPDSNNHNSSVSLQSIPNSMKRIFSRGGTEYESIDPQPGIPQTTYGHEKPSSVRDETHHSISVINTSVSIRTTPLTKSFASDKASGSSGMKILNHLLLPSKSVEDFDDSRYVLDNRFPITKNYSSLNSLSSSGSSTFQKICGSQTAAGAKGVETSTPVGVRKADDPSVKQSIVSEELLKEVQTSIDDCTEKPISLTANITNEPACGDAHLSKTNSNTESFDSLEFTLKEDQQNDSNCDVDMHSFSKQSTSFHADATKNRTSPEYGLDVQHAHRQTETSHSSFAKENSRFQDNNFDLSTKFSVLESAQMKAQKQEVNLQTNCEALEKEILAFEIKNLPKNLNKRQATIPTSETDKCALLQRIKVIKDKYRLQKFSIERVEKDNQKLNNEVVRLKALLGDCLQKTEQLKFQTSQKSADQQHLIQCLNTTVSDFSARFACSIKRCAEIESIHSHTEYKLEQMEQKMRFEAAKIYVLELKLVFTVNAHQAAIKSLNSSLTISNKNCEHAQQMLRNKAIELMVLRQKLNNSNVLNKCSAIREGQLQVVVDKLKVALQQSESKAEALSEYNSRLNKRIEIVNEKNSEYEEMISIMKKEKHSLQDSLERKVQIIACLREREEDREKVNIFYRNQVSLLSKQLAKMRSDIRKTVAANRTAPLVKQLKDDRAQLISVRAIVDQYKRENVLLRKKLGIVSNQPRSSQQQVTSLSRRNSALNQHFIKENRHESGVEKQPQKLCLLNVNTKRKISFDKCIRYMSGRDGHNR